MAPPTQDTIDEICRFMCDDIDDAERVATLEEARVARAMTPVEVSDKQTKNC